MQVGNWTAQKRSGCSGPRRSKAVRSYPSPKVRGGDGERQAVMTGAAVRSYPTSEARGGGREKLLHVQGEEGQP